MQGASTAPAQSPRCKLIKFWMAVCNKTCVNKNSQSPIHPHHPSHIVTTCSWEELRDVREMEDYTMSICADPSRKKSVVPGSKSAR